MRRGGGVEAKPSEIRNQGKDKRGAVSTYNSPSISVSPYLPH